MQAAQLLADAVSPGNPDAVRWALNEILAATQTGGLRGRSPLTLAPVDVSGIAPDDYVKFMVLTGLDLRHLVAERGLELAEATPANQAAPVPHEAPAAVPRQRAQDQAIVCALRKMGLDPVSLPKNQNGYAGVKAELCKTLLKARNDIFCSKKVFELAWERLTRSREIKYAHHERLHLTST